MHPREVVEQGTCAHTQCSLMVKTINEITQYLVISTVDTPSYKDARMHLKRVYECSDNPGKDWSNSGGELC